MSAEPAGMQISIMGRDFRVACAPDEQKSLQEAVDFLNGKMQAIKDEVEAEETGNWSYKPKLEDKHIMTKDEFPFTTKIREEIAAALKQADNTIKAMKKIKKQSEITKTKDSLAAKQKQLSDMNKPVA